MKNIINWDKKINKTYLRWVFGESVTELFPFNAPLDGFSHARRIVPLAVATIESPKISLKKKLIFICNFFSTLFEIYKIKANFISNI